MENKEIGQGTNFLTSQNCDVLIVGAGISGLVAAKEILAAEPSLKVIMIEGKDRVGGRTQTVDLKAAGDSFEKWDIGGQWVGKTQTHILELVKELDLELYDQYTIGTKMMQIGSSKIRKYSSNLPKASEIGQYSVFEILDFIKNYTKIENLIESANVQDILATPNAKELDGLSVAGWFRQRTSTRFFLDIADMITRTVFGVPAEKMSFLYFLVYMKSGGNLEDVLESTNTGAQAMKIVGGTQQISKKLAKIVGWDKIFLNQALLKLQIVDEHNDESLVEATIQNTFDPTKISKIIARRVILSISPTECSRIRFFPEIPFDKKELFDGSPQGNLLKFVVTYEKAFWKEKGKSGEILSTGLTNFPEKILPLNAVFDATTKNGKPALVGFLNNDFWSDSTFEERKNAVLEDLARFLGNEALKPVDYIDKDWRHEPYTGGCPASVIAAGNMGCFIKARQSWKTVHFAGTETATIWIGYMSGAVQAGQRAGHEVLLKFNSARVNNDFLKNSFLNPNYKPQLGWDRSYKQSKSFFTLKSVLFISVILTSIYFAKVYWY